MTTGLLSQEVAIAAETTGTGNGAMSQLVAIVADNSLPPADHDSLSQLAVISAETAGDIIVSASQQVAVVANDISDQVSSLSQLVVIVAGIEPPYRVPLFPFTIGNFPTLPMYRR